MISCRVNSTALSFLHFGGRKQVKRAQWRGRRLETDKNVAITAPHSKLRHKRNNFPCPMLITQIACRRCRRIGTPMAQ